MAFFTELEQKHVNVYGNTKDPEIKSLHAIKIGIAFSMSIWEEHSRYIVQTKVKGEKCLFSETYIIFSLKTKIM